MKPNKLRISDPLQSYETCQVKSNRPEPALCLCVCGIFIIYCASWWAALHGTITRASKGMCFLKNSDAASSLLRSIQHWRHFINKSCRAGLTSSWMTLMDVSVCVQQDLRFLCTPSQSEPSIQTDHGSLQTRDVKINSWKAGGQQSLD